MNCELSLRLQTCLDALHPLQSIADIGTDHAYLPCAGLLRGQLKRAIAADVGVGPLEAAKATISKYNLDDLIETRLGSGLSVIKPGEVEGVVIAGMGGKLITSILEADIPLAKSFNRLILQPNLDANVLRTFLMKNQFEIVDEKIVLDEKKFYEIIVAQQSQTPVVYNELDLEFGPVLRRQSSCKVFEERWQKEYDKNNQIINQLPAHHPRIDALNHRQSFLKEVLKK